MKDVLRPYVPEYKGQVTSDDGECKWMNALTPEELLVLTTKFLFVLLFSVFTTPRFVKRFWSAMCNGLQNRCPNLFGRRTIKSKRKTKITQRYVRKNDSNWQRCAKWWRASSKRGYKAAIYGVAWNDIQHSYIRIQNWGKCWYHLNDSNMPMPINKIKFNFGIGHQKGWRNEFERFQNNQISWSNSRCF